MDNGHPAAQTLEHVGHLHGDEPAAQDHQMLGKGIDPHDVVRGSEGHAAQAVDRRHGRPGAHGQDDPISGDLGVVDGHGPRAGEAGGVPVHGDVVQRLPVGQPAVGNGVDSSEYAIPDGRPVGPARSGPQPEVVAMSGGQRDIGGVHEHLRRDAAPVHAGAAERPRLGNGDVPVVVLGTDHRVAGAAAEDQEVVMGHGWDLRWPLRVGGSVGGGSAGQQVAEAAQGLVAGSQ